MGQVNDASTREGPPIVDMDHCRPTVVEIGDPNTRTEGEKAVGCGEGARPEHFTTGCAISVEPGAVPAGLTDLNAPS